MMRLTTRLGLTLAAALAGCGDPLEITDDALPAQSERGSFSLDIAHDDGAFRRGANSFEVRATDAAGHAASADSNKATPWPLPARMIPYPIGG